MRGEDLKSYVIYSKRLRDKLIKAGFKEIKEPEINIKFPKFYVFFFEDTPELREFIKEDK